MTGYGRGETIGENRKWTIEGKSVNHRFLDVSIKMPRSLSVFEEKIRAEIKKKIDRGRVDIYVKVTDEDEQKKQVKLDRELAKAYYFALEEISKVLMIPNDISTLDIASMPEVLAIEELEEDQDLLWPYLREALDIAIKQMVNMRIEEGQELHKDLIMKIDFITESCQYLKIKAPAVVDEYEEKLTKKLENILNELDSDNSRLLTEIAIMTDKMSIDEEIVRLESHLKQLKIEISSDKPVGRKLDFLIQELNREANTIGSKSNNYDISKLVVDIKTNIEKMREQVQNIE